MIHDFLYKYLNFLYENLNFLHVNLNFLHKNLRFSMWKILLISSINFLMIHKISYYKVRVLLGVYKLAGWGGISFMVCRNNAGDWVLASSVCA